MSTEFVLSQKENWKILYDPGIPCIIWRLKGMPLSHESFEDSVKTLAGHMEELIKEKPDLKLITDGYHTKWVDPKSISWVIEFFFPQYLKMGYSEFILVMPEEIEGQASAYDLLGSLQASSLLTLRSFKDIGKAKKWLRQNLKMRDKSLLGHGQF